MKPSSASIARVFVLPHSPCSGFQTFGALLLSMALSLLGAQAQSTNAPSTNPSASEPAVPRLLVLAETGGQHAAFVKAARLWLQNFADEQHFQVDFFQDTKTINAESLARYRVFIMLNYPPYAWTPEAMSAFKDSIEKGKLGWVGFHHATLLGEFDGYQMWPWFSEFMGGIRFKNYIPTFVGANVQVEDREHPVMRGLQASFPVAREEWYTYDHSPRPNVHVLASVDEHSYKPASATTMGDHPVIWSNEHVAARNVYIFMGHGPDLLENTNYTTLFHNAVLWAAGKEVR